MAVFFFQALKKQAPMRLVANRAIMFFQPSVKTSAFLDDQRNGEYGCLLSLCENGELANAIQRAIADENYLFTIQLLTELFKNKDLKPILYNLQKQNPEWKSLSELLNTSRILETYMQKLQIRSVYDCSVAITSDIVAKIKQYLFDLELIIDSRIIVPDRNQIRQRSILTQPGLR